MNQDIAQGKWKQMRGQVQQQWGKLTDDEVDQIDGSFDRFYGIMQERYGMGRDEAEKEFDKLKH